MLLDQATLKVFFFACRLLPLPFPVPVEPSRALIIAATSWTSCAMA